MPIIKLKSSDDETFEVDIEVARMSVVLGNMLDITTTTEGEKEDNGGEPIPVPNICSSILRKVIEWATYHKDNDPPTPPEGNDNDTRKKPTDAISSWDANFLKDFDLSTLFDITIAANYLDIKGLLDVTGKTVANMSLGKTPEEIRKAFKLKNDFTPEDEKKIRREMEWAKKK